MTATTAQRIQRVIAPFGFAVEACAPDAFLEHLSDPEHVCAIIDPAALGLEQLVETVTRLRQQPRPAVVCTPSSPESLQDAVRIAAETGAAVAIQSPDQDRAALARTILSVVPPTDAAAVLEQLEPVLSRLPSLLRSSIAAMFAANAPADSPLSLAARAGMSRRSLDRWLVRAAGPSARRLVAIPLVLRALPLLRETSLPLRTIATICGLRSPRRLQDYVVELTGQTPHEIRLGDEPVESLIARLSSSLFSAAR